MESFSELMKKKQSVGVNYTGKDGKRILKGNLENLRTLVNTHITILDFKPIQQIGVESHSSSVLTGVQTDGTEAATALTHCY